MSIFYKIVLTLILYQIWSKKKQVESIKRRSDAPGEKLIRLSWELLLENCLVMRKSTFFSLRKIGCITVGACILEDDLVKNTNKFFSLCSTLGKAHKSHPIALKCLFFLKSVVVVFFCWFPRRIWKMLQIIPYLDRSAAWMKKIVAPPKATKLQSNDLKKKTLLRSKLQKNYLKRRQKAISILLSRKVNRVYDTI